MYRLRQCSVCGCILRSEEDALRHHQWADKIQSQIEDGLQQMVQAALGCGEGSSSVRLHRREHGPEVLHNECEQVDTRPNDLGWFNPVGGLTHKGWLVLPYIPRNAKEI